MVATAAWNHPLCAYACDGDDRWTLALVREWWAERARLTDWLETAGRTLSASERSDERDNAVGLRDYASYVRNGLEDYLRGYGFWLEHRRPARPDEALPDLGGL